MSLSSEVIAPDVIVVGAGVLGLASAAELARTGRRVLVIDQGELNASRVAAGMIAPAMESLLDEATPERAALLKRARDLWPDFAERHRLDLIREGAQWRGNPAAADKLRVLGFEVDADGGTPDDWRIAPEPALETLAQGLHWIRERATGVARTDGGWRVGVRDGRALAAPVLVLATGFAGALPGVPQATAAAMATIQPIRGQILSVRGAAPNQVVRAEAGYLAPQGAGLLLAGATMEAGVVDLRPDQDTTARLLAMAGALAGGDLDLVEARCGVRGATPDGLPMAGEGGAPGLFVALAPRRNGWLTAPLVARVVVESVEGRAPSGDGAALDPLRF